MSRLTAAGGVLWRNVKGPVDGGLAGAVEVALVHRPRYDDWSLPKGKVRGTESLVEAAVREAAEETGAACHVAGRLGNVSYKIGGATKTVHYFDLPCLGGTFEPSREVDRMQWCTVHEAESMLSYSSDRDILQRFLARPHPDTLVVIVRHARAGNRSDWKPPDDERPLSRHGKRQALALSAILATFAPDTISAPELVRCKQTLLPLAKRTVLPIREADWASDAVAVRKPARTMEGLARLASKPGVHVVASQGDAIPTMLQGLGVAEDPRTRKGAFWLLGFATGRLLFADHFDAPAD